MVQIFGVDICNPQKDDKSKDILMGTFGWLRLSSRMLWLIAILFSSWRLCGYDMITCSTFSDEEPMSDEMFSSFCLMTSGYYQWVWILLVLHCAVTFLPCLVWQWAEGGKLERLLHEDSKLESIAKFLTTYPHWFSDKVATSYVGCQLLAVLVSYAQILLMSTYLGLGGSWSPFQLPPTEKFALMRSCDMRYIGPTAEVVNLSGVCTMNYNYIFEKLYIVLYFLFMFLTVASSVQLSLQVLLVLTPGFRAQWIIWTFNMEVSSATELQKILGYPQFLLFMLIYNNSADELNVKTLIKLMLNLRRRGVIEDFQDSQIVTFDFDQSCSRRRK